MLAETAGYYYGLAHFIVTPLVLAWLWLRRPAAFGPLRSALMLATTGANVVFWTWPVAPPRFAVPGMADVLVRYRLLGAGGPHGPDSLAITVLGLLAARARTRPDATEPGSGGAGPAAASRQAHGSGARKRFRPRYPPGMAHGHRVP